MTDEYMDDHDVVNYVKPSKEAIQATVREMRTQKESIANNPYEYQDKARKFVLDHYNRRFLNEGEELDISDIFVVWFSKTLKNWKATVATKVANDGLYFEVTHDGTNNVTYLDVYAKVGHETITETVTHTRIGNSSMGVIRSPYFPKPS